MGIMSLVHRCGDRQKPAVFVKIAPHLAWIRRNALSVLNTKGVPQIYRVCRAGQHLHSVNGEVANCKSCPEAQYSAAGKNRICLKCPPTQFRDARYGDRCSCTRKIGYGMTGRMCIECRRGFYSRYGMNNCVRCPPGKITRASGAAFCF